MQYSVIVLTTVGEDTDGATRKKIKYYKKLTLQDKSCL